MNFDPTSATGGTVLGFLALALLIVIALVGAWLERRLGRELPAPGNEPLGRALFDAEAGEDLFVELVLDDKTPGPLERTLREVRSLPSTVDLRPARSALKRRLEDDRG